MYVFPKKEFSRDVMLIMPGFFAVLVVIGLFIAMVIFFLIHPDQRSINQSSVIVEKTSPVLLSGYIQSLEHLQRSLQVSSLDNHGQNVRVLDDLMGVRVPMEMLESHLGAVVQVRALVESLESKKSPSDAVVMLQDTIAQLLVKARAVVL